MKNISKLVLVYNADSGFGNSLMDIAHKAISPETYSCSLCRLTHGVFSAKNEWSKFLSEAQIPLEIMHKDEFEKKYGKKMEYPLILDAENLEILINSIEIDNLSTTEELISKLKEIIDT